MLYEIISTDPAHSHKSAFWCGTSHLDGLELVDIHFLYNCTWDTYDVIRDDSNMFHIKGI